MGKPRETFSKKENEKKRLKKRKEKEAKREERQANSSKGKSLEEMFAYVDENGNISATPPDPLKKHTVKVEDIQIGVVRQPDVPDVPRTGTVTFFNEDKGYGFIRDLQTQESIFVHVTGLIHPIKENDKVSFEVEMGPRGANATAVTKTE